MIEKLLDEPSWKTLEEDFVPFYHAYGMGPSKNINHPSRLSDKTYVDMFVRQYVNSITCVPLEEKHFGRSPNRWHDDRGDYCHFLPRVAVEIIKENMSEILTSIVKQQRDYFLERSYHVNSSGVIVCGRHENDKEEQEWNEKFLKPRFESLAKIKDLPELFKELKELSEYKILNSELYKAMKK